MTNVSTLKVDTIKNASGNFSATVNQIKNGPAFYGHQGNQTLTRNTLTILTGFTGNEIDSNSAFDGTAFTVPSGGAGTYYFFASITADFESAGDDGESVEFGIYSTDTALIQMRFSYADERHFRYIPLCTSCIATVADSAVIRVKAQLIDANGGNAITNGSLCRFGGFRLIGV
tara:strand:- start:613 stop:1131 length:519 start_codon:yes stop_codon:yes gene_type:complete